MNRVKDTLSDLLHAPSDYYDYRKRLNRCRARAYFQGDYDDCINKVRNSNYTSRTRRINNRTWLRDQKKLNTTLRKDLTKNLGVNLMTNKPFTKKQVSSILDDEILVIKEKIAKLYNLYEAIAPVEYFTRGDQFLRNIDNKEFQADASYKANRKAVALEQYNTVVEMLEEFFIDRIDNPKYKAIAKEIQREREIRQAEIDYAPGGLGYLEAKDHFETLVSNPTLIEGGRKRKTRKKK
tara:strand:- start:7407 stop:8117 length:711 start_codon:yes stop_codon:yes gene_type:complete